MVLVLRKALRAIELPEGDTADRWSNEDIRPVPPERQTWGKSSHQRLEYGIDEDAYELG